MIFQYMHTPHSNFELKNEKIKNIEIFDVNNDDIDLSFDIIDLYDKNKTKATSYKE